MSKYVYGRLSKKDQDYFSRAFYKAVAKLKNEKEVEKFFKDFLRPNETVMISRRISIAELLLEGCIRDEIVEILKVGAGTVTGVDRWLSKGLGPYREEVKKIRNKKGNVDYKKIYSPYLTTLISKYPAHYWLLKLFIGQ